VARSATAVICATLLLSGCRFTGIDLLQDRRLTIVAPDDREKVRLPVTVRWTVHDFRITGPGPNSSHSSGYFEVLVDADPQPPGEGTDVFAHGDPTCLRSQGCPNGQYLAQKGVHTTSATSFTIQHLAPAAGVDVGQRDLHEVTIVLLDERGHRIGEGSWSVTLEIVRGASNG